MYIVAHTYMYTYIHIHICVYTIHKHTHTYIYIYLFTLGSGSDLNKLQLLSSDRALILCILQLSSSPFARECLFMCFNSVESQALLSLFCLDLRVRILFLVLVLLLSRFPALSLDYGLVFSSIRGCCRAFFYVRCWLVVFCFGCFLLCLFVFGLSVFRFTHKAHHRDSNKHKNAY